MTRSRRRKVGRALINKDARRVLGGVPIASLILSAVPPVCAQQQVDSGGLEEVVVTAQKRAENLQNVPISVQALGNDKLEELNIRNFDDYAQLLPSVSFQSSGPGYSQVSMRGVASGSTDWSGPLSTVGTYLDEQPVTTNQGTLDIHIYDIQRVEALAGPQGTLYGDSSEAGTLRIITNKPNPRRFEAAYDVSGEMTAHGSEGGVVEGFINSPLSPNAAIRLVAWHEHDPGFIKNVPSTRVFPVSGVCIANTSPAPAGCLRTTSLARKNVNDATITGGRAALKVDLDDSWTIIPMVMAQQTNSAGDSGNGYDPRIGELQVAQYYPNRQVDRWIDAALTIEGKLSKLDLVYTGAFLKRDETNHADYSDYSLAYDSSQSQIIVNDAGQLINPSQLTLNDWHYKKQSHELRISSPGSDPLHFVAGLFMQRQQHDIENRYQISGLAQSLWVTGWPYTWWLTRQVRIDRDYAAFGELAYQITPKLSATAGIRFFKADNTQNGFYGLSLLTDQLLGSSTGEASCYEPGVNGGPCTNLDKEAKETGHTPKLNLTYQLDEHKMVYATWARGFRPGGINRNATVPPYKSDQLTSYEIGWKSTWADNRVRFNGAAFVEDWKNFQFSFTGANGVEQFANAGQARIKGIESSLEWAAGPGLTISSGLAVMDPKLTANYCGTLDDNGNPIVNCQAPLSPSGTQLPGSSRLKGNLTARYLFRANAFDAYVQGSFLYQSGQWADLRLNERSLLGRQSPYGMTNFSVGLERSSYWLELFLSNAFDKLAAQTRYAECAAAACAPIATYIVPIRPRTVGLRFGQKF